MTNRRNSKQTYANSAILRSCAQADCGDALRASEFLQNVDIRSSYSTRATEPQLSVRGWPVSRWGVLARRLHGDRPCFQHQVPGCAPAVHGPCDAQGKAGAMTTETSREQLARYNDAIVSFSTSVRF